MTIKIDGEENCIVSALALEIRRGIEITGSEANKAVEKIWKETERAIVKNEARDKIWNGEHKDESGPTVTQSKWSSE